MANLTALLGIDVFPSKTSILLAVINEFLYTIFFEMLTIEIPDRRQRYDNVEAEHINLSCLASEQQ